MPAPDPLAGRSRLLRAGLAGTGPTRPFLRRALILLALTGPMVALAVAVSLRLLPLDGPGRLAYLAHDRLWLPARAQLWTRTYPFGFLWLVPLLMLGLAALVEWLLPVSMIRGVHRRAVQRACRGGVGRWLLLSASGGFRRIGLTPGFAATVVEETLITRRAPLLEALRDRRPLVEMNQAADLALLWLHLTPDNLRAAAAALEIAALSLVANARATPRGSLDPGQPPRAELASALARVRPDLAPLPVPGIGSDGLITLAGFTSPAAAQATAAAALAAAEEAPSDPDAVLGLSILILSAGLAAGLDNPENGLPAFDLWRRVRLGAEPVLAGRMAQAETLLQFGFWSALSDPMPPRPDADDLLSDLLHAETRHQPLGEGFANRGLRA